MGATVRHESDNTGFVQEGLLTPYDWFTLAEYEG